MTCANNYYCFLCLCTPAPCPNGLIWRVTGGCRATMPRDGTQRTYGWMETLCRESSGSVSWRNGNAQRIALRRHINHLGCLCTPAPCPNGLIWRVTGGCRATMPRDGTQRIYGWMETPCRESSGSVSWRNGNAQRIALRHCHCRGCGGSRLGGMRSADVRGSAFMAVAWHLPTPRGAGAPLAGIRL